MKQLSVSTHKHSEFVEITGEVQKIVTASRVKEGVCIAHVPHTTAGITINDNADPDVVHDMIGALVKLLSDDDSTSIRLLEESFRAKGEQGTALLSQIVTDGPPLARKNAETILLAIQQSLAAQSFDRFCAGGSDLETGAFLLARTR